MSESSEEIIEPKVLPKRSTRGKRMNALVGEEIQEDEEFYTGLFGGQEEQGANSGDEEFSENDYRSDARRDSFDSDFEKESDA